jgi:hypothetical protein
VAYFNGLYSEDQATIAQLDEQVAAKDQIITALRSLQQQGPVTAVASHQQWPQTPASVMGVLSAGAPLLPALGHADPASMCCGRMADSCAVRPRAWLCGLVACVALLTIVIGLAAGLGPKQRRSEAAPMLLGSPTVLPSGSNTLDLQLSMSQAGTVHYVVLPAAAGIGSGVTAADVVAASAGFLDSSALEVQKWVTWR